MRRAFFFIVVFLFATTAAASLPRASALDDATSVFAPLPETRIRVSEDLAPFERPAESELTRALRQSYEQASTTNASGLAGFLSVDPVLDIKKNLPEPQRWNRYAYVLNNPLRYTDPDGRETRSAIALEHDIEAVSRGEISRAEYMERLQARGEGALLGVGVVTGTVGLRAAGMFLMRNPQMLLAAMGWGNAALGPGGAPSGQIHHIATNKNLAGGFTKQFEAIFAKAGMKLSDSANLMSLPGHAGRHSPAYHNHVLQTLQKATEGLSGKAYKEALTGALNTLRKELEANPDIVKMR